MPQSEQGIHLRARDTKGVDDEYVIESVGMGCFRYTFGKLVLNNLLMHILHRICVPSMRSAFTFNGRLKRVSQVRCMSCWFSQWIALFCRFRSPLKVTTGNPRGGIIRMPRSGILKLILVEAKKHLVDLLPQSRLKPATLGRSFYYRQHYRFVSFMQILEIEWLPQVQDSIGVILPVVPAVPIPQMTAITSIFLSDSELVVKTPVWVCQIYFSVNRQIATYVK